jgi:DNA repair exonuclease SbcCD nuclease subunit
VVILPGNHDCLNAGAIYGRHDFSKGAPHVRVIARFEGETLDFPELDLTLWGRGMEEHEPSFSPLAGLPSRDPRRWCLAMGHGFFFEERQRPDRSSPIFADEVRDSGWDYLALGHHHLQANVSQGAVTAYYAGAPGSVLRVDFSDAGVRVVACPLT